MKKTAILIDINSGAARLMRGAVYGAMSDGRRVWHETDADGVPVNDGRQYLLYRDARGVYYFVLNAIE